MLSFSRLSTIILPIGRSGTHVSSALTGDSGRVVTEAFASMPQPLSMSTKAEGALRRGMELLRRKYILLDERSASPSVDLGRFRSTDALLEHEAAVEADWPG